MEKIGVGAVAVERPKTLKMSIHTGMLESMGVNMYTSIGKSLAEFVANGHDSDADQVSIKVPFDKIDAARNSVRENARQQVERGARDKFTVLYDPLPDSIQLTIEDNGHGMSAQEIEKKFLVVNRNRRKEDGGKSESGRYVMGRKGLGKLAGFGAAEKITVRSKRRGETYETVFTMDFMEIKKRETMEAIEFVPSYQDGLAEDSHGTIITLSGLRCDALKAKEETIRRTLAQTFAILGKSFKVKLNGEEIQEERVEYEFIYPPEEERDAEGFGRKEVNVDDVFSFPIRYAVKFRARETDPHDEKTDGTDSGVPLKAKGSLPARLRGARIYCNNRLAAGPTLLDLETGMHNFHSQSYMECIVHADEIDRHEIDHTGTNRTDLKTDNEAVDSLYKIVTDIMKAALYEHSKFRDKKAGEQVAKDAFSQQILVAVSGLSKKTQTPAKKILRVMASHSGVQSELYKEVAPLLIQSMNAGEVLTRLIELGVDPKSIQVVIHELIELAKIENGDVLKLYRARRDGIEALRKLQERADQEWRGDRYENELHTLLKTCPWLIRTEYGRYLTSDQPMGEVAKKLDVLLKIDSAVKKDAQPIDDKRRPDLVFVAVNPHSPVEASIVELKSPNIPLENEHLSQLEAYIMQVEKILQADYRRNDARVRGYLIGNLPRPDSTSTEGQLLLDKFRNQGNVKWEIIPLPQLLDRAKNMHALQIEVLEAEEGRLKADLS